jgi:hypothetical protein
MNTTRVMRLMAGLTFLAMVEHWFRLLSIPLCGSDPQQRAAGEGMLLQDGSHVWERCSLRRHAYQRTLRGACTSMACSPSTHRFPRERGV